MKASFVLKVLKLFVYTKIQTICFNNELLIQVVPNLCYFLLQYNGKKSEHCNNIMKGSLGPVIILPGF